jgi:Lysozyme like domain
MAAISGAKVAEAAHGAGFRDETLITMVAIAKAESGWNPRAHNPTPPDNSFGLWQINMIGNLGPERRKLFGIDSDDELFDPATNARAAKIIHTQQGFGAWSVFLHGTFKQHLDAARDAVEEFGGEDVPLTEREIENVAIRSAEMVWTRFRLRTGPGEQTVSLRDALEEIYKKAVE